jgi:hypothetical protein
VQCGKKCHKGNDICCNDKDPLSITYRDSNVEVGPPKAPTKKRKKPGEEVVTEPVQSVPVLVACGTQTAVKNSMKIKYAKVLQIVSMQYAAFKSIRAKVIAYVREKLGLSEGVDEAMVLGDERLPTAFRVVWYYLDITMQLAVKPFLGWFNGNKVGHCMTQHSLSYLTHHARSQMT